MDVRGTGKVPQSPHIHRCMSNDTAPRLPENVTALPAVVATRALVAHGNGDHQLDENGPQGDCPACSVEAA